MPDSADLYPNDELNQTLLANVHPPDWKNPEPAGRYNLVVIGAGTAGLVAAAAAAGLGARVALVERHLMGGDCLNVGCVPSKAIIRSSRMAADIRDAEKFGIIVPPGTKVDFTAVMARMRRLRAKLSPHDSARRFQELGVDVFLGDARFSGRDTVEAAGKQLRFKKAVIATGAKAVIPPIEGLAEAGFFTNETIFNLTEQPRRLAVLGGGPLGCELAQAFSRLGCEVTMIEIHSQFLPREDPQVARLLAEVLTREGITIRLGTRLRCVTTGGDGKTLHLESSDKEEVVKVDAILVGTGRAPNIGGLNLESAGVNYSQAGVIVSDRLQTTNSRIFAAGDVCLQYKFTHTADATARIVIQNSLFLGRKKLSALTIPWCTYTDPEVAHVGLSEQGARLRNVPVTTFQIPLDSVDRAVFDGEDQGFARIHVRPGTDRILGATIVARHAGNIISEISLAMVHNIGLGGIAKVIHPYPTQAEVIKKAGDVYSRTRLTPSVERLFTRWLTWRR